MNPFRVLAALSTLASSAQEPVTGRLIDPSNTGVTGVAVVLRQRAHERTAITAEAGQFRFEGAPSGEFELRTELPGFDPVILRTRDARPPADA